MTRTIELDDGLPSDAADMRLSVAVDRLREADPDGRPALYRAELSDRWNAAYYPFGGYVSAVALQAIRTELDRPEHTPRSLTTVFSSPVKDGPVEIEVQTLRAGRGMSQVMATLRNAGSNDAGHTTIAVLGSPRDGFSFTEATPPDVPDPEHCELPKELPADAPFRRATFFEQIDVRHWNLHWSWETDWEGGRAEASRWMRYRVPPRRADGVIDPLAYVPICDTMPPSLIQRLGPGHPPFFAPSCDLTVHFLAETRDEWALVHVVTEHAGDGYASATLNLWDRDRRLLARATQMMFLRMDVPSPG